MKYFFNIPLLLIYLLSITCVEMYGQIISEDSLRTKIARYTAVNPGDVLYIATDKSIYLPTETIWFAGYLIEMTQKVDTISPNLLSVALQRNDTTAVSLQKNYLINNGFCPGSLTLPDTLTPGNYILTGCTNILNKQGKPIHVFRKEITIKTGTSPSILVDFKIRDITVMDSIFIDAKVYFPPNTSVSDRSKSYISYNLQNIGSKKIKIGTTEQVTIALPISEVETSNHLLYTTTTIGKSNLHFNVKLPIIRQPKFDIRFHPEGGDLITGLQSKVAWESRITDGGAVQLKALLLENEKPIDTIETDKHGLGWFNILPKNGNEYTLKIMDNKALVTPNVYPLPKPLPTGIVLEIPTAVVGDTLSIRVGTQQDKQISLAITNAYTKETKIAPPIAVNGEKRMNLLLNDVSKGMNTLTLLDDDGQPLAERQFFAHYKNNNKAVITIEKDSYNVREKVSAKLRITDAGGQPLGGIFTVSCVQNSRLDTIRKNDIVSHFYTIPLMNQVTNENSNITELYHNQKYLENMLFLKGGQRSLWQQLTLPNSADAISKLERLKLKGQIEYKDKSKIKKTFTLLIRQDSLWNFIPTDKMGVFLPDPKSIVITENGYLEAKVMEGKRTIDYTTMRIDDPMLKLMQSIKMTPHDIQLQNMSSQSSKKNLLDIGNDKSQIQLKEVVVKGTRKNKPYSYGANKCGDYICVNGYLNCPGHSPYDPDNKPPPVKGETYKLLSLSNAVKLYQGCLWEGDKLGVYTTREFYGMDESKLKDTFEKYYMSTVFWKPFITAVKNKETSIDFYTSDQPGTYKIKIEGIAENGDFVYEEKTITINKE